MTTDELALGTEPDAASRARRLVAAVLDGSALVEDAQLVVTELLTNAQLHGAPPLRVRVRALPGGVRLEVQDASRDLPLLSAHSTEAMTGRGIALVRALTSGWGVEPSADGKTVWAELRVGDAAEHEEPDLEALLEAWSEEDDAEPLHRVVLGPVPTRLLLEAKRHIDNVVRELALDQGTGAATAALVAAVTEDFAAARAAVKRQAAEAALRGDPETDLVLVLPASAAAAGERYLRALEETDGQARDARLLTLETPPLHKLFRRWYVGSAVEQLRALAEGRPRPAPTPFVEVLGEEVAALAALRAAGHRLSVLQQVNADLAAAENPAQTGDVVLQTCVEELGALSGRVHVVDGDVLRSVAVTGGSRDGATAFAVVPLAADLPGPVALRTRRNVVLSDRAHAEERFPDMAGALSADRALHVVPLLVGTRRVGVLSLGLPPDSRVPHDERGAFVQALADVLAQALDRLQGTAPLPAPVPGLDHAAMFRQLPTAYVVMDRDLVLVDANDAYLATVGRTRDDILGRGVFDAFPPTEDALEPGTGVSRVQLSFERARDTGQVDVLPVQRYDIPDPVGGGMVERFWSLISVPLLGPDGTVAFLAQRAEDITDFVRERERGRRAEQDGAQWRRRAEEVEADLFARGSELDAALAAQREAARTAERMSEALQRSLLTAPPPLPGADLAVRYRPAAASAHVGGDWYDAFVTADDAVVLTLGDVAGHDREAAAAMGQLRNLLRGLAWDSGDGPARLLSRLDAAVQGLGPAVLATAVLVRVEQRAGGLRLHWSSAGHPPGLVRHPDGGVAVLPEGDLVLGVDAATPRTDRVLDLPAGSTLVLFTDGLVERRDRDLGEGLEALRVALAAAPGNDVERTADALLAPLGDGADEDDVALLVLRATG